MAEVDDNSSVKKPKYEGSLKKRKWQERITDANEAVSQPKSVCTDETRSKLRRRKFALLLSYSGVDYYGMQRNIGMKTIEEDLVSALFKAQLISEENFKLMQTMQFQRAARTDKGVSAARQTVSLKMAENATADIINEHLPECIRVFSVKRATKGFNSKNQCNARTYSYMLPTYAFTQHKQIAEVCSVKPKNDGDSVVKNEHVIVKNEDPIKSENSTKSDEWSVKRESLDDDEEAWLQKNKEVYASLIKYRTDDATIERVNDVLKMFLGTKNFHNFTSRKKFGDPSANRFIISFECDKPFVMNDVEFAILKVKGQSFMLHQIRKMIGIVIAIVRGLTDRKSLDKALTSERVDIPMAPGLGLILEQTHYDWYANKYRGDGVHDLLDWQDVNDQVEEFKCKFIYSNIVTTELQQMVMFQWLKTLGHHSYDVREDEVVNNQIQGKTGKNDDDDDE